MTDQNKIKKTMEQIKTHKQGVAFTGAGMSTASGIPDFRSAGGIWSKYDMREYASLDGFKANPVKIWEFFRLMQSELAKASPNAGHTALASLEKKGYLAAVITQNIDLLHTRAGNKTVYELHGSADRLQCLDCDEIFAPDHAGLKTPDNIPRCSCGAVLKPAVVLFGEALPQKTFNHAVEAALQSKFCIVAGTSAVVYPAAQIPYLAKRNGSYIIEINYEETPLTRSISDIFIQGKVEEVLPEIDKLL